MGWLRPAAFTSEAGVLHVWVASESSPPSFATIAAQTVRVCTLLAGWSVAEAQCYSLCCIADVAGLLHVRRPTWTSAALHLPSYECPKARVRHRPKAGQSQQQPPTAALPGEAAGAAL